MSKHWTELDPQAAAEAEKYGNPVPSREFLLQLLERKGVPMSHSAVCRELQIEEEEPREAVSRRLKAMCRDGQLMSNRKRQFCLLRRTDLISARVLAHRDGYGFAQPEKGGDDLYLSPRQMRSLLHGDRILVQEVGLDMKGRPEGKVVEIQERAVKKLVGRYMDDRGSNYLMPESTRLTQNFIVVENPDLTQPLKHEQMVVGEILRYPNKHQPGQVQIIEVLGDRLAPGMEITVALHNYDVPHEWPDAVRDELAELTPEVSADAYQGRIDLRELPLVTIDGEDARDFDDAIYAERKRSGGWRLWVAIADVSWYVKPQTELDKEAVNRGNSVYFPGFVVPMLPEVLSNGLCSLNPEVDRLAMVCEMTISERGAISSYRFCQAVIRSHARLTYTKVGVMLEHPDSEEGQALREQYAARVNDLETLHALYRALRAAREVRGAIDFDTTETRILFSDDRKIEQILPVTRNDAHKIVEECMLCANVATAKFLEKHKIPALYRVHEGPKPQKLESLRAYLNELGLHLSGKDDPEPLDYQKLAEAIEGRPDQHIIETMMLRSMQQAVYSPDNQGHFGLAYPAYTHFTSPIRRYPDLMVHRAIRSLLVSDKEHKTLLKADQPLADTAFKYGYGMDALLQLGEHCSMTERRADDATRDVESWLKCEYMQSQVGERYWGVISAVTGFGVFVELSGLFVEGLVHVTSLPNDYYHFEASHQRLIGERTRRKFSLGDKVYVQVVRVDLEERKIDFDMLDAPEDEGGKAKSKKPKVRELLAAGKLSGDEPPKKQPSARKRSAAGGAAAKRSGGGKPKARSASGGAPKTAKSAAGKPKARKPRAAKSNAKRRSD